ncbi:MAG TPA: hypothetical protein VE842_00465 [Pyrinomonadaceae bacterium]|jgi:hypothetical protein|nr:hypothetical protein [Pyrinomonadaceae bacterium]
MAENETEMTAAASGAPAEGKGEAEATGAAVSTEEITYHAVEKDGQVTAIWEMQGRKHLRTIDPRSRQGQDILRLYTSEHHEDAAAPSGASEGGGGGGGEPASS